MAQQKGLQRALKVTKTNDRPGSIDDGTAKRLLVEAAGAQGRDIVIMELKSNLVKLERQSCLSQLSLPHFRKVAAVVVGEPAEDFKKAMVEVNLAAKQAKLDVVYQAKLKNKAIKKQVEDARIAADRKRKEIMDKVRESQAIAKKRRLDAEAGKTEGEAKDEESKEDEVKEEEVAEVKTEQEEEKADEEKDADMEDVEEEEPAPVAELTPEEKKGWNRLERTTEDLDAATISAAYQSFTLPQKDEGFDEIRYLWQQAAVCEEYVQSWKKQCKQNTKNENFAVGPSFVKRTKAWQSDMQRWQKMQQEIKVKVAKEKAGIAATKAEADEKDAEEDALLHGIYPDLFGDITMLQGKNVSELLGARVTEEFQRNRIDVFGVENISDTGDGEPLFMNFSPEDWALAGLRFELWLLTISLHVDTKDPDMQSIPLQHLAFYYNRYFKKALLPKLFGVENVEDVVALVADTVSMDAGGRAIVCPVMDEEPESFDIFVKLTEASRVERLIRVQTGDAQASLKFSRPSLFKEMGSFFTPAAKSTPWHQMLSEKIKEVSMSSINAKDAIAVGAARNNNAMQSVPALVAAMKRMQTMQPGQASWAPTMPGVQGSLASFAKAQQAAQVAQMAQAGGQQATLSALQTMVQQHAAQQKLQGQGQKKHGWG